MKNLLNQNERIRGGSNAQPVARHQSSSLAAHQFASDPKKSDSGSRQGAYLGAAPRLVPVFTIRRPQFQ
jgi:hypothetical protein